ncbi:MAG TPA: type II toxin-antitoxin system prevent-host-death family antitoxin [Thermoanaerobaculia bacterium]|nr:type II toxin-antitoxin system prevent-host-death family antitoxin [Thermoanaerobaculia bacterium]
MGGERDARQVGVRELRQNLSRYLDRVTAGERFEITDRNLPVAILAPLPGPNSVLEGLVAAGRIVPARLALSALGPPPDLPYEKPISEALAEQRREGREPGR